MKRTIVLVVAAGLLALSLAGCGGDKDCSQYPAGSADYFACKG